MAKKVISRSKITNLFVVDMENGRLFWKSPPKNHAQLLGREAGFPSKGRHGKIYWIVKINGVSWKRSELIYIVKNRRPATPMIDHKDGNSLNDHPDNLRSATTFQNSWNHKSRKRRIQLPMGVRIIASSGRFGARITHYGKQIHLGSFSDAEQASRAYQAKRKELFGEFS